MYECVCFLCLSVRVICAMFGCDLVLAGALLGSGIIYFKTEKLENEISNAVNELKYIFCENTTPELLDTANQEIENTKQNVILTLQPVIDFKEKQLKNVTFIIDHVITDWKKQYQTLMDHDI